MLVKEAAEKYMVDKGKRLRASTLEGYRSALELHVLPRWADVELDAITPEGVQAWVDDFELPGAAEKAYKTLRQVIRWAIRRLGVRMYDPTAAGVELPRKETHRPRTMEAGQVRDYLRALWGHECEAVAICSVTLGLRRGEACGLRWSDIDGEYVNIHTAIVEGENGAAEKGPKSYSGARRVHLPAYLRDLLARTPQTDEHITTLTGHAIYCGFSRVCEKAGVPHYRFHDLRHPYVKHTTKIFSLRLMDFQAQAYPDARRKTRGACQLHRGGQSQSPVRPLCNRKRFS